MDLPPNDVEGIHPRDNVVRVEPRVYIFIDTQERSDSHEHFDHRRLPMQREERTGTGIKFPDKRLLQHA